MSASSSMSQAIMGWREWVALPDLGIPGIRAKADSGARSSVLHAHHYEVFHAGDRAMVRFVVHPLRFRPKIEVECESELADFREVRDTGGRAERRPFIVTRIALGERVWSAELCLTNREDMRFRMLLGRSALAGRFMVDPAASYLIGKSLARHYRSPSTAPRRHS